MAVVCRQSYRRAAVADVADQQRRRAVEGRRREYDRRFRRRRPAQGVNDADHYHGVGEVRAQRRGVGEHAAVFADDEIIARAQETIRRDAAHAFITDNVRVQAAREHRRLLARRRHFNMRRKRESEGDVFKFNACVGARIAEDGDGVGLHHRRIGAAAVGIVKHRVIVVYRQLRVVAFVQRRAGRRTANRHITVCDAVAALRLGVNIDKQQAAVYLQQRQRNPAGARRHHRRALLRHRRAQRIRGDIMNLQLRAHRLRRRGIVNDIVKIGQSARAAGEGAARGSAHITQNALVLVARRQIQRLVYRRRSAENMHRIVALALMRRALNNGRAVNGHAIRRIAAQYRQTQLAAVYGHAVYLEGHRRIRRAQIGADNHGESQQADMPRRARNAYHRFVPAVAGGVHQHHRAVRQRKRRARIAQAHIVVAAAAAEDVQRRQCVLCVRQKHLVAKAAQHLNAYLRRARMHNDLRRDIPAALVIIVGDDRHRAPCVRYVQAARAQAVQCHIARHPAGDDKMLAAADNANFHRARSQLITALKVKVAD